MIIFGIPESTDNEILSYITNGTSGNIFGGTFLVKDYSFS